MNPKIKMPQKNKRSSFFYLLVGVLVITAIVLMMNPESGSTTKINLNTLIEEINNKQVKQNK